MAETTALARMDDRPAPVAIEAAPFLDREKIELLKRTICKGATDDEFQLFMAQVQRTRLDPFVGQIHAVKRWDRQEGREIMTVQVGVAGLELIATRTEKFQGLDGPYWCGEDGQWLDVWLREDPPRAAKVGVYREGFVKPLYGVALWDEYVQTSSKTGEPAALWKSKPTIMIAKCAESLALRKAFPAELSGLYAPEEMGEVVETTATVRDTTPPARQNRPATARGPKATATASTPTPAANAASGGTLASKKAAIDELKKLAGKATVNDEDLLLIAWHQCGVQTLDDLDGKGIYTVTKLLQKPEGELANAVFAAREAADAFHAEQTRSAMDGEVIDADGVVVEDALGA